MHLAQDVHSLPIQDLGKQFQLRFNRFLKKVKNLVYIQTWGAQKNPKGKRGKGGLGFFPQLIKPDSLRGRKCSLSALISEAPSHCAGDFLKVGKH